MTDEEKLEELVKKAATEIISVADSVEIIVGKHRPSNVAEDDNTLSFSYGLGDWYSRYGRVREWLLKADERIKVWVSQEDSAD